MMTVRKFPMAVFILTAWGSVWAQESADTADPVEPTEISAPGAQTAGTPAAGEEVQPERWNLFDQATSIGQ